MGASGVPAAAPSAAVPASSWRWAVKCSVSVPLIPAIKARVREQSYEACQRFGANPVLAFWLAYILTRPLGAALGDLLSQSPEYGGVGWGTVVTSAVFLLVIAALVAYLHSTHAHRKATS